MSEREQKITKWIEELERTATETGGSWADKMFIVIGTRLVVGADRALEGAAALKKGFDKNVRLSSVERDKAVEELSGIINLGISEGLGKKSGQTH